MGLLASLERRKIQDQMSLDLMQLKVEYFGWACGGFVLLYNIFIPPDQTQN